MVEEEKVKGILGEGEALVDLSDLPEEDAREVCLKKLKGTFLERGKKCIIKIELEEGEDYGVVIRLKEMVSHDGTGEREEK